MRKVNICYYFFDCWYKYSEYNLNTKVCVYYFILFFYKCFDLQCFIVCHGENCKAKYLTFCII